MLAQLSITLIRSYQNKGGSKKLLNLECNFEPTCSEYTKQCIQKYGALKGWKLGIQKYGALKGWKLGIQRIKRCNQPDLVEVIYDEVP